IAAALYLAVLAAATRLLAETWLRTRVKNLKNLHAVLTVCSTLSLLGYFVLCQSKLPRFIESAGEHFAATLNPFSLPAELARSREAWWLFAIAVLMIVYAGAAMIVSSRIAGGLVRRGLHAAATAPRAAPRRSVAERERSGGARDRRAPLL